MYLFVCTEPTSCRGSYDLGQVTMERIMVNPPSENSYMACLGGAH